MRRLFLLIAALSTFHAAPLRAQIDPSISDLGPPPTALLPYLTDGMPNPDKPGWMRGAYAGASATEQRDWRAVQAWIAECFAAGTKRVRAELQAMGEAVPKLDEQFAQLPLCDALASLTPDPRRQDDWPSFLAANAEAKRVFDIFLYGAKLGAESTMFDPDWVSAKGGSLLHATRREQVYRGAFSWEQHGPKLRPLVWKALERRISLAVTLEDRKNTAMLKTFVAENGWPTVQAVGKMPSYAAWLLVQHADHDPAFQLKALRLMEPLVASGGVTKTNYAYLYDRVMLKVRGTQRYGTQAMCRDGKRVSRPEEAGTDVDALRRDIGLEPVAVYLASMDEDLGACPK